MPDMTPVGNQIRPVNPLNAFSQVLGIRQQQIGIQQGQAQAQQAQQQNQELQALHSFTAYAAQDPSYQNPDGSLNVQKFQQGASQVAPVYGQAYIGQATQNAESGIKYRGAMLDLTNKQRSTIGGYLGSVAAKPDANREDVLNAIQQARDVSPDPSYQRSIDSMLMSAPNTHGMTDQQASQTYRQWARNLSVATNAMNAGESAPQIALTQGPQGLQATQTSPQSPLGIGPQGAPIQQGTAPTYLTTPSQQLIRTGPGGQAQVVNPNQTAQPPQVPGKTAPLTAGNDPQAPKPNAPGWEQQAWNKMLLDTQNQIQGVQQADAGYQTNMAVADNIRKYAADVTTGPGTEGWTRFLGTFNTAFARAGIGTGQSVANTQTLKAFLDLNSSRLRESMGLPETNAGLATSKEMGTDIQSQKATILAKTDYYQALTQLQHYYRMGLDAAGNNGVNPSPTAVNKFKSWFTKNADPLAVELMLAHQRGDNDAIAQLQKGFNKEQRQQIADHVRTLTSFFSGFNQ